METKELLEYPSVARWSGRVKLTKSYVWGLKSFIEWARINEAKFYGATPDSLIEYQKGLDNGSQYEVLDVVQAFISSMNGRHSTKSTTYNQIRSFFAHNRAPLPKDPRFNIRGDIPPVKGILKPENIRDVIMASNKLYRALFLCMFQGCMDLDMVTYWSENGLPALREALDKKRDIVRVDLPGRKKLKYERPYYTFIGPDAVKALRDYLPKDIPEDREAIFLVKYREAFKPIEKDTIYRYWMRKLVRLDLIPREKLENEKINRYGMNPHEMRDVWRTLWSKSPADHRVGEYLMGHVVDPLGYDKSFDDEDYTRREYEKALPMLQIISSGRPFGQVDEGEIERLNNRIKELEKEKHEYTGKYEGLLRRMDDLSRQFREHLEQERK